MSRALLALSLLAACSSVEPLEPGGLADLPPLTEAVAPAPTPPGFDLGLSTFTAGAVATVTVSGAPPNTPIRLAGSTGGVGEGPCFAGLAGACLGVRVPVVQLPLQGTSDAQGDLVLNLTVPSSLSGDYLALQAVALDGQGTLSNVVARSVWPAGSGVLPGADQDVDGVSLADGDCDDLDAAIVPGAPDAYGDGVDANCDGADGEDADGDGASSVASAGVDCDDTDPTVGPEAVETCNGVDDDCDGVLDEEACTQTETFDVTSPPADILMVVDNSCSMAEEQSRLTNDVGSILTPLLNAGADFHLGVVSTDTDDPSQSGRLTQASGFLWIDGNTPNPAAVFNQMALLGTGGSINERGLDASFLALTQPLSTGYNVGFRRSDADLHLVYLSDEGDQSVLTSPTSMAAYLNGLPVEAYAHTIVGPVPGGCATSDAGLGYTTLNSLVGGVTESLCALSYQPVLETIADQVLTGPSDFPLALPADPTTLVVTATGPNGVSQVVPSTGYTYDATTQTVTLLAGVVPPGSTVEVSYLPAP